MTREEAQTRMYQITRERAALEENRRRARLLIDELFQEAGKLLEEYPTLLFRPPKS